MTRRSTRRGSQRRGLATFLLVILGVFGLTFAGTVMGTAGGMFAAYTYFSSDLPDPNMLNGIVPAESTYVYDRTGEVLLARFECQNREAVEFEELPDTIWEATIASEDRTFWDNNGVDFQGLVRAALANLEAGEIVQGASTITQQVIDYARVLQAEGESTQVDPDATPGAEVDPADPDAPAQSEGEPSEEEETDVCEPPAPNSSTEIDDKIRENILAMQVTSAYPGRAGKERILETYLNLIYYGNGSYGIKAAAANYFGLTDLAELTVAQASFLAALPQAPSFLDPYQNPNGEPGSEEAAADAIRERDLVLGAMVEEGYITAAEAAAARDTTWTEMNPSRLTSVLREPQFSFRVREEAARILESLGVEDPEAAVRIGGYRITTTLDYELQQEAKALVAKWVSQLGGFNVNNGGAGGHRLDHWRDRGVRRQRRLLQPRGPARPGPVRRRGARHPSAGVRLQADHVLVRLQVPRRHRLDDVRRCHDRVRAHRRHQLSADERGHQGARARPGARRPALQPQHPIGPDAVPRRLAGRPRTSPSRSASPAPTTSWASIRGCPSRSARSR